MTALLVTKDRVNPKRFVLHTVTDGQVTDAFTANSAQMILDYVRSQWPVGTQIQFVIK